MKIKLLLCLSLAVVLSSLTLEASTYPFVFPTSDPIKAKFDPGWSFELENGAIFSEGRTRQNFFGVSPWETGWVVHAYVFQLGFGYTWDRFHLGFQLPIHFGSTSILGHYAITDQIAVGAKFGYLSSLYSTLTVHPSEKTFVTFSPSVQFISFGFPRTARLNETEFLGPVLPDTIVHPSRLILNAQVNFGFRVGSMDIALIGAYGYAPGNGLVNKFIFDDTLLHHFVRTSVGVSF